MPEERANKPQVQAGYWAGIRATRLNAYSRRAEPTSGQRVEVNKGAAGGFGAGIRGPRRRVYGVF